MLTIIHGADFHLDAPFAALPPDKARARRAEQRELLDRLAGLAEERRADVVLLSGDLLDGGQTYQETVQALARTLGGIPAPVFIAPGNHDWLRPPFGVRRHGVAGQRTHLFHRRGLEGGGAARPQLCGVGRGLYHPPGRPLSPDGLCRPTGRAHPPDGPPWGRGGEGTLRPHRPGGHRRQRPDLPGPGTHPRLLRAAKGGGHVLGLPRLSRGPGL